MLHIIHLFAGYTNGIRVYEDKIEPSTTTTLANLLSTATNSSDKLSNNTLITTSPINAHNNANNHGHFTVHDAMKTRNMVSLYVSGGKYSRHVIDIKTL